MKRDFVTIDDLGDKALLGLMDLADRIRGNIRGHAADLPGFLMGSLFLEPSTRTRLSFETAMLRLGGRVVTSSDPNTSSAAKGESLADTVRIVDSYVDLMVLRHPAAGAARLAASLARGPVINAGDGSHEHPTQTLCDLYALRCERKRIEGLTVVLYGDLRYGRTTHSLSRALVRFGGRILAIAQGGLQLPDFVVKDLLRRPGYGKREVVIDDLEEVFRKRGVPALLIGPEKRLPAPGPGGGPVALPMRDELIDAIYVTRLQKERLKAEGGEAGALPILDHRFLKSSPFSESVVLHPLPRVQEIAVEVDADPRAGYFRQAALGVPIRMALLLWAAGAVNLEGATGRREPTLLTEYECGNPGCISVLERGFVPSEVGVRANDEPRCLFCEEAARKKGS